MTAQERPWLLAAGVAHIALFAGLSLAWQQSQHSMPAPTDAVPVELVDIADAPRTTEPPRPSIEAAPQEPAAAPEAQDQPAPEPLPEPLKADAVPPPEPTPPKPEVKPRATAAKAPPSPLNTSNLANLIDKSLPKATRKPLDTSKLAKDLGNDVPKAATIDPRAAATLAQAIRAQVAPCWNPPAGGRDVRRMTVLVRVNYSRDGRVVGIPVAGTPSGTTATTADYARAFADTARRAVLRCQPLKLPADMYPLWQSVEINFDPEEMT
jgi:outer membrane biosynthesis protein TonB